MAVSNRQRVEEALEILRGSLERYFEKMLDLRKGPGTWQLAVAGSDRYGTGSDHVDLTRLFDIFHEYRNEIFRPLMGAAVVGFVHGAVRQIRDKWAHQEGFDTRDTLRALDTVGRILEVTGTPAEAERVEKSYAQLHDSQRWTERARTERARSPNRSRSRGERCAQFSGAR